MKRQWLIGWCAVCVAGAELALAQDAAPKAPPEPPAAQPEARPDYSIETIGNNPGPIHQRLARLVGEWETASKFVLPGQEAAESAGAAEFTTILGGRFLVEHSKGSMMGEEFSSMKLWGYNSASQRYESVWTYTGSTSMMTLTGSSKDDGKTVAYEASYESAPGRREQMTVTLDLAEEDRFTVKLTAKGPDGQPAPEMVTTYTRKKKP